MKTLRLLALALVALLTAGSASAQEIIRAFYGVPGRGGADVTAIVQGYVDQGRTRFPVNNDTMGGDPVKGKGKTLTVQYRVGGQVLTTSMGESGVIQLRIPGGGGRDRVVREEPPVRDVRPRIELSDRGIGIDLGGGRGRGDDGIYEGAIASEVRFRNNHPFDVTIQSVDRWGGYRWVASVPPGGRITVPGRRGQVFFAVDPYGRVLKRVRADGQIRVTLP